MQAPLLLNTRPGCTQGLQKKPNTTSLRSGYCIFKLGILKIKILF